MLRLTISSACSRSSRWNGSAPQQPPPATRTSEIPTRSSTRAIAASITGASAPCTQLPDTIIRRGWRASGQRPGATRSGSPARSSRGRNGFRSRPAITAAPKSGPDSRPARSASAFGAGSRRARHLLCDDVPADVDEPAVLHARRAGRLAGAAREAAIEVQLRLLRRLAAFEHLLDQIDAPARTVELVAQELIRRARREAEAAMHARAQDRVGLAAVGRVADEIGERGLH